MKLIAGNVDLFESFVILGSAPYVVDYWNKRRQLYIENGFKIITVNNAWSIEKSNKNHMWFYPCDFKNKNKESPDNYDFVKIKVTNRNRVGRQVVPYYKDTNGKSGTMLINVLHYLCSTYDKCKVSVIGSDYVYGNNDNGFYGNSTPDALRYGKEWLISELDVVNTRYKEKGSEVYVDTPLPFTLLPFTKITF